MGADWSGVPVSGGKVPQWIGARYKSKVLSTSFGFLSLALIAYAVLIVVAIVGMLGAMAVPVYQDAVEKGQRMALAAAICAVLGTKVADAQQPTVEPAETVEAGFRIILKDPSVKVILINIFGGIVRCDRVAQGVVDAYKSIGDVRVPVIVRLQGTNAEEAKELIDKSGLKVFSAITLQEAADLVKKAV